MGIHVSIGNKVKEEICSEYDGVERRKHCELVIMLKQQYEDDKKSREEWRQSIEEKLESVCRFISNVEGPYHAGLWAVRILFGAFILGLATAIIEFVRKHWN